MPLALPTLDVVMKRIRDKAKQALVDASIEVHKDFIYTGEPPHDDTCSQLVVYLETGNQTQTNPLGGLSGSRQLNRFVQLPTFDFVIEWVTCAPSFGPGGGDPAAEDYEEAHSAAALGISVIYQALVTHIKEGTLVDGLVDGWDKAPPNCRLNAMEPGGVSGGAAWYTLGVTVVYA